MLQKRHSCEQRIETVRSNMIDSFLGQAIFQLEQASISKSQKEFYQGLAMGLYFAAEQAANWPVGWPPFSEWINWLQEI